MYIHVYIIGGFQGCQAVQSFIITSQNILLCDIDHPHMYYATTVINLSTQHQLRY